ncbi:MAG: epoxyqueuosine reductase [Clostridia bacterium]|nr:epoxyqueuosine reductase [Clostridia bacterium]
MREYIIQMLKNESIELCCVLPLSATRITKPYLLERCGISSGSAICFAIPYYTEPDGTSNISAYARAEDYHAYTRELGERLCSHLQQKYPQNRFALFSDHSPIDERHAAASAGLGVIGRHGMLITERYSSYVFLGELITDADLGGEPVQITYCEGCGACVKACPYKLDGSGCLSALTQKKGELTPDEVALMRKYGSAWGCDICSEVCPHTARARKNGTLTSPIPFFNKNLISHLTVDTVTSMDDTTFARRAYSWRSRETIIRNLKLMS